MPKAEIPRRFILLVNFIEITKMQAIQCQIPAGYNNLEVAEYLLEQGADVNAQDKGGLIPLHNASSYGHLDIAALLIKYNTVVNATDKWGFTPLHEAAQKGRTQLCALLVSVSFS
jgi:tankyrase